MIGFIKKHEAFIIKSIENADTDFDKLLALHKTHIEFLQHERLIHLLVTLTVLLLMIAFFTLSMFLEIFYLFIIVAIITVLLLFYIFHYYRLENEVQRWYLIYDEILLKTEITK